MTIETVTAYTQAVAMALGAVWNGILAYEAHPKIWRVMLSAATAVLLIVMAWRRLSPFF